MKLRSWNRTTAVALFLVFAVVAASGGCARLRTAADETPQEGRSGRYSGAPAVEGDTGVVSPSQPQTGPKGDVAPGVAEQDRLIVRTKSMRLQVKSTVAAVERIRALTKQHDGIITDLQVATDTDEWIYRYDASGVPSDTPLRGWVTVRIPGDKVDAFSEAVAALGVVKSQSEGSEDVTQQHVDLSARLANLKAEEARLREFFDAAKNVSEMLSIEQELARVRGEIESLDAQVKYLERQAALATVTIELVEDKPVVRPEGESWGFREAITEGVRGAARVLTAAVSLLIASSPIWVVGLVVFFVVRATVRRRRARTEAPVGSGLPTEHGSADVGSGASAGRAGSASSTPGQDE